MHIEISNFHNISSLAYDIAESKVNFLYGVSGSGKSSIVKGISRGVNQAVDVMVGCEADREATVTINGESGPLGSTTTFDGDRKTALFSSSPDRRFYDIFIGNEDELNELRAQYGKALSALQAKTGSLLRIKGEVNTLTKTLGKAGHKQFSNASKMGKALKAYKDASKAAGSYIEQRGMNVATWVKTGFEIDESYVKGICPFCGQDLESSPQHEILAELRTLSVKDLKPVFDSSDQLAALGQDPIDISTEEGRGRAFELVSALPKVSAEIDRIVRYCSMGTDYQSVQAIGIEPLELDPSIYTFIPELREVAEALDAKASMLKKLLGKMKMAFNTLVKNGCNELNHKLTQFGIPYRFELTTANREEKIASYRLVHVNASDPSDMRDSLSFGEKNLITLLLFLRDSESEVMLIDDPASSYDDYRRTQIFRAIMGVQGKTLLVVSHDQAFVRRAVRAPDERIGNVDMLCNRSGKASVEPITKDSFDYFEDIIRRRIATVPSYYQRMLNARLLCDAHGAGNREEELWGYVSAILHRRSRNEVLALLAKAGKTEEAVLESLKTIVGEEAASGIIPMPDDVDYGTDGFSEFERLIALREDLKEPGGGNRLPNDISKDLATGLLDDLVHMNDAMMDCIDPYRYPVWSPTLFKLLE